MLPPRQITPHTNTYRTLGELTPILPGLYLSSLSALQAHLAQPRPLEITHVLSVLDFSTDLVNFTGSRLVINLADDPNADLLSHLDECVQFVQSARQEGGMVVVHCLMGLSRSVCVVVACVMVDMRIGVQSAIGIVRSKRGWAKRRVWVWTNPGFRTIRPNAGFVKQLETWSRLKTGPGLGWIRWSWPWGK